MSRQNAKKTFFFRDLMVISLMLSLVLMLGACKNNDGENNPSPTDTVVDGDKDQTQNTPGTEGESPSPTEAPTEIPTEVPPSKKDIKVKALYLTGWTVGVDDRLNHYVELAKNTEINAYVVDIKDDDGYVGYESNIPAVREMGTWMTKYNADKVLKTFHDNDIHVIGRLVCFKDPLLSAKKPELAVKNASGGLWKDKHSLTWLDPYNKDSWPYLIEIAREAVEKGFDEIQFDYVRFPNDGDKKAMNFASGGKEKHEAINEFLSYAKKELPGVVLSADVFGIILESPADTEDIGQYLELIGKDIEYISPMVYPSHYAVGQRVNGVQFMKPDFDPYGVVYQSLAKCKDRLSKVSDYKADVRAYIQGFTASYLEPGYWQRYGPEQMKQQIKAVYDAGYEEWIFWDATNRYPEDGFLKE